MDKPKAFFMTVESFKSLMNVSKIDLLEDKASKKKSFQIQGMWFPVQTGFDLSLPMAIITSALNGDGTPDWSKAGLCNVDDSKAPKTVIGSI